MENTIIQRIREILDKYELSVTSLAKKLCMSQPTLNRQLTGENSLSLETVNAILYYYQDISAEWLLRGEGEMIKGENKANGKCDERKFVVCVDKDGFLKLEE